MKIGFVLAGVITVVAITITVFLVLRAEQVKQEFFDQCIIVEKRTPIECEYAYQDLRR